MRLRGLLQSAVRAIWLAGLLGAVLVSGCHRDSAEVQVGNAIRAAATAARANDVHGVLAVVSVDFIGNGGDFDRVALQRLLAVRALRQDQTGVLVGRVTFTRRGDRMLARFNLVLTGGRPGDLLPAESTSLPMTTAWRRVGGKWLCYSAQWSDTSQ